MPNLGGLEWVIILVIVLLLFGVGRLSKLGEELGKGISSFRRGVREGGEEDTEEEEPESQAEK